MGLGGQNSGKKIGINGSPIYHVTTLPGAEDQDVKTMNLYWKESASILQSEERSSLVYFRQMAAIIINVKPLLISIPVFFVYSSTKFILFWF